MFRRHFLLGLLALSCIFAQPVIHHGHAQNPTEKQDCPVPINEYQSGAVLWTQSSGEYRALSYQAYTLARLRLDEYLRRRKSERTRRRPPAVVVDVDETILNNSRFQAELILHNQPYDPASWQAWCERAEADAVIGAVPFLNYAARRGVRVFYITNRRSAEKPGTIRNLQKLNFPGVSEETVMVREKDMSSSKESRRQSVRSHYDIALLMGDNLNDFNDDFAGKSIADRSAQVDREQAEFGAHFIVLPNPMYGDWEDAINHYQRGLTPTQQLANRRAALKGL